MRISTRDGKRDLKIVEIQNEIREEVSDRDSIELDSTTKLRDSI